MVEKELPDSVGPWLFLTEKGPFAKQITQIGNRVLTSTGFASKGRWIKVETPYEWLPKFEPDLPDFMPEGWWVTRDQSGVNFHDKKPDGFCNYGWDINNIVVARVDRLNYDWNELFSGLAFDEVCFQKPYKKENNDH